MQNVLLERCLLVAGEPAIIQALDSAARAHLRVALQISYTDDDDDDDNGGCAKLLAACLDRCLENHIQLQPQQPQFVGAFVDIVLAGAEAGRMPLALSASLERILQRVLTSPLLLDADVRFIDVLLKCGGDIASVLRAVLAAGERGSPQYYRVVAYALLRLAVLVSSLIEYHVIF